LLKLSDTNKLFINPKIVPFGENVLMREGCLSVPDLQVSVKRPEKVFVKYYDDNWNYQEEEFGGIIARIIQHEHDHLFGKMIID